MEGVGRLIKLVSESIPQDVGEDASYLIIAAVIISSADPAEIGPFYRYLADEVFDGNPERKAKTLSQIRDLLMKSWTLIGIPPVLAGIAALAKEEDDSCSGESVLSEKWADLQSLKEGGPVSERGMATMRRLYGPELLPKIFDSWGSLRSDVVFLQASVIYGLYLSDFSVLSELQSECISVACLLCTGFPQPSLWHLRGLCRLLGARGDTIAENSEVADRVQRLEDAIGECVRFYKMEDKTKLKDWPKVVDVERKLGGFGS